MELEIKKPKPNGSPAKQSALQKPRTKMQEAMVVDGGKRGRVVKVCADPTCRVHHPNTPSPQQVERERVEERRRIEIEKLAITTRHRILAAVLQRVSVPLKKADLLTVAEHMIRGLSHSQVPVLAKRHKVEANASASEQELLAKQASKSDEAEISKLLLEISLLDSAYQRSSGSSDPLMDAAKRYRVDTDKIGKAVAETFAAKQNFNKVEGVCDSVLLVCGLGTRWLRDAALSAWLKKMASEVRRLGAVCVGAFLLAEAGLLNARRATTHWRFGREMATRYPHLKNRAKRTNLLIL